MLLFYSNRARFEDLCRGSLGGCAGALLLSTYLIPVFGFWKTAWLCAVINLAPALLAARESLERKRMER
jgi:predicted membrane-bound spermidine synthase